MIDSNTTTSPNFNKSDRPQPLERKRCNRRTRFNSILPVTREKFVFTFRKRLSDLCREYQIDFASGEGIVLTDIRTRQIRRCTQ